MKPKSFRPRRIAAFVFVLCLALFLTFKSGFVSNAGQNSAALLVSSITATNKDVTAMPIRAIRLDTP